MLINYSFKNFKSYLNTTKICLEASKIKQYEQDNSVEICPSLLQNNRILKSLLIFGPNSAGKTNAINALKYARFLILYSANAAKENDNIFDDPDIFLLDEVAEKIPYEFKIEFIVDKYQEYFEYSFSFMDKHILKESLYKRDKSSSERLSSKKCLFDRKGNEFLKISEQFKKILEVVDISDKTLLLSLCGNKLKEGLCEDGKKCYAWFSNILFANAENNSFDIYDDNPEYLDIATKIIQFTDPVLTKITCDKEKLDLGLIDYKNPQAVINALEKNKQNFKGGLRLSEDGLYSYDICTVYKKKLLNGKSEDVKWSVFEQSQSVSSGVRKLVIYLAPIIKTLKSGGLVLVDEIDTALHYLYSKLIVSLFNSTVINKNMGQAIFTSHNVRLMDERVRTDQIYLVSKDNYGRSSIQPLYKNKTKTMKTHNISERYIQGLYQSVADIDMNIIENLFI